MAVRSLIVKIGASTEEIDRSLEKLGANVRKTDAEIKKLGNTPLAEPAQKSMAAMTEAMNGIVKAQERVAERARLTAVGLEQMGGAARLTSRELAQVSRTVTEGTEAFRALGRDAPKELERVAAAIKKQQTALDQSRGSSELAGRAQSFLTGQIVAMAGPAALGLAIKQSLSYADSLTKLSDRTGIGVVGLQRLDAVASASGNTIDTLANAVNQFQKRLVEGEIDAPIARLGLAMDNLRAQSPDDQFFAIARAIKEIPDPAERSRTAIELFGRSGAELLPTLIADVDKLADSTFKMSATAVKALDDAGDAWGRYSTSATNIIGELTGRLLQFQDVAVKSLAAPFHGVRDLQMQLALTPMGPNPFTDERKGQPLVQTTEALPREAIHIAASMRILEEAERKVTEGHQKQATASKALAEEMKKLALAADVMGPSIEQMMSDFDPTNLPTVEMRDFGRRIAEIENTVSGGTFGKMADELTKIGVAIPLEKMQDFGGFVGPMMENAKGATHSFGAFIAKDLPAQIVSAFAGGGNVGKTIGSSIGGQIAKGIGGTIGSLLGPVGAILGGAAGGLFGKLFGDPEKQINPLREAFVQANGGLAKMAETARQAGTTLDRLLQAKNPKQYEAAVKDLNTAFDQQAARVGAVNTAIGDVSAAYTAAGNRMPAALRETLASLGNMAGLSEETRAAIGRLAESTEPNFAVLQQRAGEFGITLEALGKNFQAADLDRRTKTIVDLFGDLTEVGGDAGGVLSGLSDEISTLVNDAKRFGVALPESIKPLIENLLAAGKLTDAAGNKLEDLTDVTFKDTPLDKGSLAIVDAIEKLGDLLRNLPNIAAGAATGMADAFRRIPPVRIPIEFPGAELGGDAASAATGGLVTANGIQQFGRGGRVLPFLRRGSDTVPAMLTPGEIVLNAGQQRAVAGAMGGVTLVANVTVQNNSDVTTITDEHRMGQRVSKAIMSEVERAFRRGR